MASLIWKRLFVLSILLFLIIVSLVLTGRAIVNAAAETKTLDRDLEPVVVEGTRVTSLIGSPVEHLFIFTYTGTTWGDQIPIQVDEVTASGNYTNTEDGLLDANDEIVFMAKDLGDRAPDTDPLTASLTISDTWYEIEVTDPLSPTKKGWAYLVRSSTLTHIPDDYVGYNATTEHITTSQYKLGFATTGVTTPFFGINHLELNGSGDILDRSKLRVDVSTIFGSITFTEENLTNPETVLIKDGPVRVLLRQTVSEDVAGQQFSLNTAYKAYASLLQGTATANLPLVTIDSVRTSVDFDSAVSGDATFYNANTPTGVTIDGDPTLDAVDELPLSKWTQVSHTTGRLIQVTDPTLAGGTEQKNFYCDDNTPGVTECDGTPRTGDSVSYGDTGILFEGNINETFTIPSSLFILPPPNGGPDNVGDIYETYYFNPLIVTTGFQGSPPSGQIFLPIVLKN